MINNGDTNFDPDMDFMRDENGDVVESHDWIENRYDWPSDDELDDYFENINDSSKSEKEEKYDDEKEERKGRDLD